MKYLMAAFLVGFFGTHTLASTWNESVQGDLSDNNLVPTPLVFDIGVNHVSGTMGRDLPQLPTDRDIFTVTIPVNQTLTSINVVAFTPTNQSFYAIAPGTSIDVNDPGQHLSNTLVKNTGEILDDLALGSYSGGTGLTDPLPSGTYTFWFQELSSVVTYDITYTVAIVPEPAGLAFLLPVAALSARRRSV